MVHTVAPETHSVEAQELPSKTIIVIRERAWESAVSDTFTLGALAVLPWFNHVYGGGSAWIYAAIAFAWFLSIFARASGQKKAALKTPAEARAWLDEQFPLFDGGSRPPHGEPAKHNGMNPNTARPRPERK